MDWLKGEGTTIQQLALRESNKKALFLISAVDLHP